MNKKCNSCNEVYEISQFSKCKKSKGGFKTICKKCQKKYRSEHYLKNKEREKEEALKYYHNNVDGRSKYRKYYRQKNKDKENERGREYYQENIEKRRTGAKKYYYENKEECNEYARKWKKVNRERIRIYERNKLKNDICFKISHYLRSRVRSAVKSQLASKKKRTNELVGCAIAFLKKHIESQFDDKMTWDNYGYRGWHIDHIKPCASFDLTKEEQQKECFNYSNLQPLWWQDNLHKSDKVKLSEKEKETI